MIKKYCQKCGSRIEYRASEKPNFCPRCGISLSGAEKQDHKHKLINSVEIEAEEERDPCENITGLDVDISFSEIKREKLGNIIGTRTPGENEEDWVPSQEEYNLEEFEKNFKQEAGTLRGKPRNEGNE